jgi:hypothetical protein
MAQSQFLRDVEKKVPASDDTHVTSDADSSLRPDAYEKVLAAAAIALFLLISIALIKGRADWAEIGPLTWVHLATVMTSEEGHSRTPGSLRQNGRSSDS